MIGFIIATACLVIGGLFILYDGVCAWVRRRIWRELRAFSETVTDAIADAIVANNDEIEKDLIKAGVLSGPIEKDQ